MHIIIAFFLNRLNIWTLQMDFFFAELTLKKFSLLLHIFFNAMGKGLNLWTMQLDFFYFQETPPPLTFLLYSPGPGAKAWLPHRTTFSPNSRDSGNLNTVCRLNKEDIVPMSSLNCLAGQTPQLPGMFEK